MNDYRQALNCLKSWRKRDDNDNGFSKNIEKDAQQTLHEIYDAAVAALQTMADKEAGY